MSNAELVNGMIDIRDEYVRGGPYWQILDRAITALSTQDDVRDGALEEALGEQPSTAENPNEDSYQRGRFDGIMEFARAILALKSKPAAPVVEPQPVPPTADDLLWQKRGNEVCDFFDTIFANTECSQYPTREWMIDQWRNFAKAYEAITAAQETPQSLEAAFAARLSMDLNQWELLSYDMPVNRAHFAWLIRAIDKMRKDNQS